MAPDRGLKESPLRGFLDLVHGFEFRLSCYADALLDVDANALQLSSVLKPAINIGLLGELSGFVEGVRQSDGSGVHVVLLKDGPRRGHLVSVLGLEGFVRPVRRADDQADITRRQVEA